MISVGFDAAARSIITASNLSPSASSEKRRKQSQIFFIREDEGFVSEAEDEEMQWAEQRRRTGGRRSQQIIISQTSFPSLCSNSSICSRTTRISSDMTPFEISDSSFLKRIPFFRDELLSSKGRTRIREFTVRSSGHGYRIRNSRIQRAMSMSIDPYG